MPFYCTLTDEDCHAEVFKHGGEHTVVTHVGYDGVDKTYSLVVGLSPQGGGDMELFFVLAENDGATDDERFIYDGREVGMIIEAKGDREKVLGALLGAAQLLLERAKPKRFIMTTYDGYLPEKAMLKYRILNNLFIKTGYTVTATDPYYGKHSWWMDLDP
jgi:hypothetical protein